MRPSLDQYLMGLAMVASQRTTCIKRAVGCVLADAKGHVLSIGYNGVASGRPHCNEEVETSLASVKAKPGPEHWEDDGKFYLRRMLDGVFDPGCEVVRPFIRPSTVKGCIGVHGYLRPHACAGHSLPSGQDSCEAVHAEQNALLQCRDVDRIRTAYVTLSPCKPCMKLLLNTPCERIVFHEEHTDPWPGEQWRKADRAWDWLTE